MSGNYKFKCLQCGKKFKTSKKLSYHQKHYHAKHDKVKSEIATKKKEIKHLERKIPSKGGTNWVAIIVFLILVGLFFWFFFLR